MIPKPEIIKERFGFLGSDLITEITREAAIKNIPADMVILRENQYVKVIPVVISGLIKVFTTYREKELLLYYIQPNESCIMSFAASLKNEPSRIMAITEKDTQALLLPVTQIERWTRQYPGLNSLFFRMYNERYVDLLDTINNLIFNKLDERIVEYLHRKSDILRTDLLDITHKQMASELGTAREVISRILKKLEQSNSIRQEKEGIRLLDQP